MKPTANIRIQLGNWPLRRLRELVGEVEGLIATIEKQPRRELDIAADFSGRPERIAAVLRTRGTPDSGTWYQLLRINCAEQVCAECPHGDFWYRYRRNKRKRTIRVQYVGKAVFSQNVIERLSRHERPPVAVLKVEPVPPNKPLQPTSGAKIESE